MAGISFPFDDGERLLAEDADGNRYALTCRYRYASRDAEFAASYVLVTNFGTLATYDLANDVFRLTPPGRFAEVPVYRTTRAP